MKWTDENVARVAYGSLMYMMSSDMPRKLLKDDSPNAYLTLFASVLFYMDDCYHVSDKQYVLCVKVFIRNLEKGCKGMHIPDVEIENKIVPALKKAKVNMNIGSDILDVVLDHLDDDDLFPISALSCLK